MESRDYLELTYRSINCFADDGKLDADELASLIGIAKRDGVIDENERRVLKNIVSKVRESEIDTSLAAKIEELDLLLEESL